MQNMSVLTLKPLGQQLVETGLLTEDQLETALKIQTEHNDKLLGQVLIEQGFLSEDEFEKFMQTRMAIQQPLGELLIQREAITREQLHAALSVQMQAGPSAKPLGQLLVDQGAIAQETLDDIVQQQYQEQENLRKKLSREDQQNSQSERSQVEDIQQLLRAGLLFMELSQELLPETQQLLAGRYDAFQNLYHGKRLALSDTMQSQVGDFMTLFLPVLELGFRLHGGVDEAQEANNQVFNAGFFALMEAFQRLCLPTLRLSTNFYLNSLILTDANDIISLREALYIVMRSPYLLPHGSLMALRFLLNEFWGQRSILEARGIQIVRDEDDMDLSDFFRPRMDDVQDDLQYIEHMESHLFSQIEYSAETLADYEGEALEYKVAELLDYYRILLQTYKDHRETLEQKAEPEQEDSPQKV